MQVGVLLLVVGSYSQVLIQLEVLIAHLSWVLLQIGFESPYNKAPIIRFEEIMKICTQFYIVVDISFKKCIEKVVCNIAVEERCYTFRDNVQNCTTLCFQQRCYTICENVHKVTHNPETGQGLNIQFIVWVQILLFLHWSVHYFVSFYLSISCRTWLPNSEQDN